MYKNVNKYFEEEEKKSVYENVRKYLNFKVRIMKSNVKIDFMVKFNWYKGERVNGNKKNGCCYTFWINIMFIWKDGNNL